MKKILSLVITLLLFPATLTACLPPDPPATKPETKTEDEASTPNIFESMPSQFVFTSGAGGWDTTIYLNDDGTFEGIYHDSEMGDMSDDYPGGTVYISKFKGKFKKPTKIDKYIYSTKLDSFNLESATDEENIEDDIRYITTEPYGFEGADEFLIYLPGCPTEAMEESFLSWAYILLSERDTMPKGKYGIYNIKAEAGFTSYDDE